MCFWMFFTFSLPIKAIPPLNYVSRKKPWAWTKMRENNPVLRVSMWKESIVCVTHTMHETWQRPDCRNCCNGEVRRSGVAQHTLENDHQIGWKKKCGDWTGKELLQTKTKRSIAHQEVPKFQPESGPWYHSGLEHFHQQSLAISCFFTQSTLFIRLAFFIPGEMYIVSLHFSVLPDEGHGWNIAIS